MKENSYKISRSYARGCAVTCLEALTKYEGCAKPFDMRAWEQRRREQGKPLTTVSNHKPRGKQKIGALM